MTSLISSIFGGGGDVIPPKSSDVSDLFDSSLSVPSVLHTFTSTKKKNDDGGDDGKEEANAAPISSEGIDSGISNDEPSSSSTLEDEAPSTENTTTPKKTVEQLKEEEERTIFVGNLPPDITRRSLAGIFKPCGTVVSTRLRSMAVAGVKLPPEQAGNQVIVCSVLVLSNIL